MSLQTDTVGLFRSQWATRFVDEVDVLRFDPATPGVFNETTGQYDGQVDLTILSGGGISNCLIRGATADPQEEQLPPEQRTLVEYEIYFAHDSPLFEIEDKIVVVSSLLDPDLDGLTLVITSVQFDSYNSRRKVVAEIDSGRGSGRG